MNRIRIAVALLAIASFSACISAPHADEHAHTLIFLKTGPQSGKLAQDENDKLFAGHFANMERLAREGHLLIAGPFGEERHDKALRGIFVLDTGDRATARALAETDPPTRAGVFVLDYHDLSTSAALRKCHDVELARSDAVKATGRVEKMGESIRGYVLLTAEHGDVAERELIPLVENGGVLLLGRLDGTRAFAVLDAVDLNAAHALLGPIEDRIGAHVLDPWFASKGLADLPKLKP